MECVDVEVEMRALLFNAITHLGCGFFREGEGQDLGWGNAVIEEMEDLVNDYFCFTGTGTGEDELDAGGGDGFGLSGVEGHC